MVDVHFKMEQKRKVCAQIYTLFSFWLRLLEPSHYSKGFQVRKFRFPCILALGVTQQLPNNLTKPWSVKTICILRIVTVK